MLFVTFLLSGIILFLLIYAYSVVQLKKQNNGLSSVAKTVEGSNKSSFFDKFRRKKAPKIEPEIIEDSSVTVGGVTAKVSASIKQVVAPIAEKVPNRKGRTAPRLNADSTEFSKSKQTVNEKEAPKSDTNQLKSSVEAKDAVETIDKQESKVTQSVSSDVALELMAEEYAAQRSESDQLSPDVIEQVYADQKTDAVESVDQAVEKPIETMMDSSEISISQDAQQDLLEQVGIGDDRQDIKHSDVSKVCLLVI